ncbi:hypothetical protein ATO6_08895 [Oceanicola sp. 22II-s10i]|uniref:hypothetical protein n=1 Tax=Oceanicola sp. 22II-s10i TaxID=1317116 RepID=UPI000B520560|nr:hypothetical protein [Oceanicola sp. 22II-s10i]OWU85148.1 hypothetical protein ATO6_08895 [Oceanicola sp. 22II-s10i]
MTRSEALAALIVMIPAVWGAAHLAWSRVTEIRADRLEARQGDAAEVTMLRQRARTLKDFSSLLPSWMLAVLIVGLVWRCGQLIAALL